MSRYLREGRFVCHPDALFYVERILEGGKVRRGLMGMVDLEQYDYEPGVESLVRATEGTVLSRIPPRVAVRKNAPIELPHVMLLADDPEDRLMGWLSGEREYAGAAAPDRHGQGGDHPHVPGDRGVRHLHPPL